MFLKYLNRYTFLIFIIWEKKKLVFHSLTFPKAVKKALTGIIADGGGILVSASFQAVGTVRLELTTSAM